MEMIITPFFIRLERGCNEWSYVTAPGTVGAISVFAVDTAAGPVPLWSQVPAGTKEALRDGHLWNTRFSFGNCSGNIPANPA